MEQKRLRIAVQKSGRLYEESVKLLGECGIDLRNVKDRLRTESDSFRWKYSFSATTISRNMSRTAWPTWVSWVKTCCWKKIKKRPSWKSSVLANAGCPSLYPAASPTRASLR